MTENIALGTSCDANSTEPDFYVHGLCFSPYLDGQTPPDYVPPEQIRERLAIITKKHHTDWIRTYSATHGSEKISEEAHKLGLHVAMGTWIRHNKKREFDNLVTAARAGFVDIAVVGNEELFDGAASKKQLINDIKDVRQRLIDANCADIPVTTPEPFDTIFELSAKGVCTAKYPDLIEAVDVVFVNIYPFHRGVHIDTALANLIQRYQYAVDAVGAVDSNKPVIIGETGWASDGLTIGDAEPSLTNIARYFHESASWAVDNNIPMFYFTAFDEKWKAPPEIEAHWGIWSSNGYLKHTFVPEPSCGRKTASGGSLLQERWKMDDRRDTKDEAGRISNIEQGMMNVEGGEVLSFDSTQGRIRSGFPRHCNFVLDLTAMRQLVIKHKDKPE